MPRRGFFSSGAPAQSRPYRRPWAAHQCRPCQGDGRGGLVFLTDAGKRLFDEAAIVQRDVIRRLFLNEITPEEIDMLTGLFSRVSERINNDTPCP